MLLLKLLLLLLLLLLLMLCLCSRYTPAPTDMRNKNIINNISAGLPHPYHWGTAHNHAQPPPQGLPQMVLIPSGVALVFIT